MRVKEIMTPDVALIPPTTSVRNAAVRMAQSEIGMLVVGASGVPQGIVTDRDIVIRAIAIGEDPDEMPVSNVMSPRVLTISDDHDIEEAFRLMHLHKVRRLPVIDEVGSLCGIVSLGDIAQRSSRTTACGEALAQICTPEPSAALSPANLGSPR